MPPSTAATTGAPSPDPQLHLPNLGYCSLLAQATRGQREEAVWTRTMGRTLAAKEDETKLAQEGTVDRETWRGRGAAGRRRSKAQKV